MKKETTLPPELQTWVASFQATEQAFIRIFPRIADPGSPNRSRLGGQPYWPLEMPYPYMTEEMPLYLLVQINFSEVPPLEDFPRQGILQVFISSDSLYGMDYELPQWQDGFRIVFHPEPLQDTSRLLQDFSFLPEPEDFPFPWDQSFLLEFAAARGIAPPDDPAFIRQMGDDFFDQFGDDKWSVFNDYRRYAAAGGHKLGAYPHFPQEDPRPEGAFPILLLQLDSDEETGLQWGDRGTAHFFINPEDLAEKDFTKVFYSWSSY